MTLHPAPNKSGVGAWHDLCKTRNEFTLRAGGLHGALCLPDIECIDYRISVTTRPLELTL